MAFSFQGGDKLVVGGDTQALRRLAKSHSANGYLAHHSRKKVISVDMPFREVKKAKTKDC